MLRRSSTRTCPQRCSRPQPHHWQDRCGPERTFSKRRIHDAYNRMRHVSDVSPRSSRSQGDKIGRQPDVTLATDDIASQPRRKLSSFLGARAAVLCLKREGSSLGTWISELETRAARNVVIVATDNKLARITWAVLASRNDYQPRHKAPVFSN